LRSLIDAQAAEAAESKNQVNHIFEGFNSHVQNSFKIVQDRLNEQQNDTKQMLEAIIGLNSQVASFQSTKLTEMANNAAQKLQQAQS
jgi:hypothetical protein